MLAAVGISKPTGPKQRLWAACLERRAPASALFTLLPSPPLQAFVELALRVLEMLGAACLAAGSYQEASIVPGEGELGMGTGSGERPHAQVGRALHVWRALPCPWDAAGNLASAHCPGYPCVARAIVCNPPALPGFRLPVCFGDVACFPAAGRAAPAVPIPTHPPTPLTTTNNNTAGVRAVRAARGRD